MARCFITKQQLRVGMGPGDTDGNTDFGIDIEVYDTVLKRLVSGFARITNQQLINQAGQNAFNTARDNFVNNAIIAAYAAQGITVVASDILRV